MKKFIATSIALLCMLGCSSTPPVKKEKPQPKPPEVITGRSAFQKLYIAARGWAPDAQPFRLESQFSSDSPGHDGKADVWGAWFGSAARAKAKPYQWSGITTADSSPGIDPGSEDSFNPNNSSTHPFDVRFIKVDSDAAYETAQKHGGSKLLDKKADTPVSYILEWANAENELIWHVIYGTNRDNPDLRVAVNASTGEFIRVEK